MLHKLWHKTNNLFLKSQLEMKIDDWQVTYLYHYSVPKANVINNLYC